MDTWEDFGPDGDTLVPPGPVQKTIYKTGVQNGLPAVRFQDDQRMMRNLSLTNPITQPCTVFFTCLQDGGYGYVFDGQNRCGYVGTEDAGGKTELYAGAFLTAAAVYNKAVWYQGTATFNGANSSIRINGVEIAAGDAGTNTIGSQFQIGNYLPGDSTFDWEGYIGEVIVYSGVESPAANEAGLMTKWGIS